MSESLSNGQYPTEQHHGLVGRGSWIRTNDLQYPKLPRYQAALYPDQLGNDLDTRLRQGQQEGARRLNGH
jgi:hypothetical protein